MHTQTNVVRSCHSHAKMSAKFHAVCGTGFLKVLLTWSMVSLVCSNLSFCNRQNKTTSQPIKSESVTGRSIECNSMAKDLDRSKELTQTHHFLFGFHVAHHCL